jgi:hypothetical protein
MSTAQEPLEHDLAQLPPVLDDAPQRVVHLRHHTPVAECEVLHECREQLRLRQVQREGVEHQLTRRLLSLRLRSLLRLRLC